MGCINEAHMGWTNTFHFNLIPLIIKPQKSCPIMWLYKKVNKHNDTTKRCISETTKHIKIFNVKFFFVQSSIHLSNASSSVLKVHCNMQSFLYWKMSGLTITYLAQRSFPLVKLKEQIHLVTRVYVKCVVFQNLLTLRDK